ncbi:ATP-dependent DNA helicase [Trichonephila clavipes]|nr:ATP-dependent DNA helicase [Trichonephila clavipes]
MDSNIPISQHLKNFPLDLVTERLISPRIPFMQIRRLRHVLVNLESMDNQQKRKIKAWLQHLKDSPLYTSYGITVDDSFFNGQDDIQDEIIYDEDGDNDISEQIPIDESLVAQQQTLMWNDEMYLTIAPGEKVMFLLVYYSTNMQKRIEFQHRGSPHAHILAWLDNAPEDALGKDYSKAIDLIDSLISVSAAEASACASTGKAATAIGGSTVHSALSISLSRLMPLNIEKANQYRTLFKFVKVLIIDEISMVSAELLEQINVRLKQITGLFTKDFGGLDVILIGDLRQLPPVKATPIFKQIKRKITGETPWRKFKQFELKQVMRQQNRQFSEILTKIGDGNILTEEELKVMESRFITKEEAQSVCPEGIRLLFTNAAVNAYNYSVLNSVDDKIISVASDVITGCHNPEQENFVRQKLHKMKTDETGGLPYELILVLNRPYMITNNIDVADGLSNGTVGKLYHVERDENGDIIRIWLQFPKSCGRKQATKLRNLSARLNLDDDAVPITSQTSSNFSTLNYTKNKTRNILNCPMKTKLLHS